jgi:hypothetical protein
LNTSGEWEVQGGDWFDANETFNGPNPYVNQFVSASPVTHFIGNIDGDIRITGVNHVSSVMIDGSPAEAFWIHPTSGSAIALTSSDFSPVLVRNPTRGDNMQVFCDAGATMRIDKVAGPVINDYTTPIGPSNTPTIWRQEMTSLADLNARAGYNLDATGTWANNPEFGVDADGTKYLRFSSWPSFEKLISWFLPFGVLMTSGNVGFGMLIEADVDDYMNEHGMKLPGPTNEYTAHGQVDLISLRMWHGPKSANNPDLFGANNYWYYAGMPAEGGGFPSHLPMPSCYRAGVRYWVEMRWQMNTQGVADGYGAVWMNGNLVWESNAMMWQSLASNGSMSDFYLNIYHGGNGRYPTGLMHYRLYDLCVSDNYIGPPAAWVTNLPSWRPASGVRANRGSTTMASVAPSDSSIQGVSGIGGAVWYSGGVFAPDLGQWGSVIKGGSGHNSYYGNEIYRGDLEDGFSLATQPHTQLFLVDSQPGALYSHSDINNAPFGAANGEHWVDGTGAATLPSQPGAFQWYAGVVVLPPGVGGAGANGALVTPMRDAMTPDSGKGRRSHILQLNDPAAGWARYSNNLLSTGGSFGTAACVAAARNKIYLIQNLGVVSQLDLTTRLWSNISSDVVGGGDFSTIHYMEAHDLVVTLRVKDGTTQMSVLNPNTNAVAYPTITGAGPTAANGNAGSTVWVEELNKYFHYQHNGHSNTLFSLNLPANPFTGTWTWTSETLTGDTPLNDNSTSQYTRLFWSTRAQVLIWLGGPSVPLQVWTPAGV